MLGVRSGASWDEVRIRLVPGQKPEDFDEAARALACARAVTRCQIRELSPNVVSIDFQRRNLLTNPVACPDLTTLAEAELVEIKKGFDRRRPQTTCRLTAAGRKRFREYLAELEQVLLRRIACLRVTDPLPPSR